MIRSKFPLKCGPQTCLQGLMLHGAIGIQIAALLGGCGPARPVTRAQAKVPAPEPEKAQIEGEVLPDLTKRLGLWIVPESTSGTGQPHFKSPDSNVNTGLPFNRTSRVQGNQISFFKALHLPQPQAAVPLRRKELFFVWPENSLESPIVQAWITHRVLDGANHWIGCRSMVPARRDAVQQRWFISILDIFGDSAAGSDCPLSFVLHEANTQVLILDLVFADQTRALIEVRFRVKALNDRTE